MDIPQDNPQLAGGVEWLCEVPPETLQGVDDLFRLRSDLKVGTAAVKLAAYVDLEKSDSRSVISDGRMSFLGSEGPVDLYVHAMMWVIGEKSNDDRMSDYIRPVRAAIAQQQDSASPAIAFNLFSNEIIIEKRHHSRGVFNISGIDVVVVDGVPGASRRHFASSFNSGHPSEAIRTLAGRSKENFAESEGPVETFELLASAAAMLIDRNEKKKNNDWQNDHTANAKFRKLFMIVSEDVWGIVAANYGEIDHNDMWKKFSLQMSENAFYWSNVATRAKQIELY